MYCTDVDWVEWRRGKPAAIVEITRCMGGKKHHEVAKNYLIRREGFQAEVAYTIANALNIPAYLVVIDDFDPQNYDDAIFSIYRLTSIKTLHHEIDYIGEDAYCLSFLNNL